MSAKHILLAVGEDPFRAALAEQLELHNEFAIVPVTSGEAAIQKTNSKFFDLILLDFYLGKFDGLEVCKILRKSHVKCPIIILMSAENHLNFELGMEFGADDCVMKPFKLASLLSCIRSHLHKHEQSETAEFTVGPYKFMPSTRQLIRIGNKNHVRLTDKESSILIYLFRAGNSAVSRDVLLNEVWGYTADVTTHTLETHIYRLRQKIECNPSAAKILITEPGGYRLVL